MPSLLIVVVAAVVLQFQPHHLVEEVVVQWGHNVQGEVEVRLVLFVLLGGVVGCVGK